MMGGVDILFIGLDPVFVVLVLLLYKCCESIDSSRHNLLKSFVVSLEFIFLLLSTASETEEKCAMELSTPVELSTCAARKLMWYLFVLVSHIIVL